MLTNSTANLPSFIGAIPGIVGLALRLLQLFGEQSRYLDKKRQLELFKMKCEIEALRRRYRLEIPQVLAADDIEKLRTSGLPWFDAERVRGTFWFRIVHTWRPAFILILIGLISLLALGCIAGAVVTLYSIVVEEASGSELSILFLIFLADVFLTPILVASSIRMFIGFKDARASHLSVT